MGARLIGFHEAAVANNVGNQDRGQSPIGAHAERTTLTMSPSLTTSNILFRFADDATLSFVARASGAQAGGENANAAPKDGTAFISQTGCRIQAIDCSIHD
jgi:hypothetical protein